MFEVSIGQSSKTEYLKMVPLPSWWQKLELKDILISELFEELLSWNSESKLITPKYITGTFFGAIVAIFNFCFSVFFLCVMSFITPERAPKAGPCHLFILVPSIHTWPGAQFSLTLWHSQFFFGISKYNIFYTRNRKNLNGQTRDFREIVI